VTDSLRTIVVTGAAGFLGSHLVDRLAAAGARVIALDNLSMGSPANLAQHRDNPAVRFYERDVTAPEAFDDLGDGVDCVVHLAAFKIPRYGGRLDTLRTNARGTEHVLEFARRTGCKCVLASTSDVYGRNPDPPFAEDDATVLGSSAVARWSYAVSKLFDEHLGFAYQERFGIPVTTLRFFGSYGPRHHLSWWGGPQSVFIDAVLRGQEIPIHGDGLQTRSFTYVSDTVEAMYAAIVSGDADGEIFNVGSRREITILELARLIKQLAGGPGPLRLKFIPYDELNGSRYEDVRRRVPDVGKCERVLGVKAIVDLEDGLARTIAWQRALVEAGRS
jgi:UDP-glucose 4-epimerase